MTEMKHYFVSDAKYLCLDIPVPYEAMLKEAQALKHRFTEHRGNQNVHKGWKSLSLYGIDEQHHESWQVYGFKNAVDAANNFVWTTAADACPITVDWLKTKFPTNRFGRVRLMLLEARGWISPHTDTSYRLLENINIPLSNPEECKWVWGDGETLDMKPGKVYAMNISYEHAIYNNSDQDRFHLIVARHDSTDEWKTLIEDSAKKSDVQWEYLLGEIAT
jgi:hypothetical protein